MLLLFDVGNTNTVLGLWREKRLLRTWRIASDPRRTGDEYAVLLRGLLEGDGHDLRDVADAVISSVVPAMERALVQLCREVCGCDPLVVQAGIRTGMPVRYEDPAQVGADRVVNAVAAYARYRRSLIVIDLGTATTFDLVTEDGAFEGGAIAPGLGICADALFAAGSKLPRVPFELPPQVVAKNTVHSMQSGILYGYAGLIEGMVGRMKNDCEGVPQVVATGGLAPLLADATDCIDAVEPELTLEGLALLYGLNRP